MSNGLLALAEGYVVQPGDTLTGIAEMAGISVDRIVELNGLASPDTIFVGDTLLLAEPTPVRVGYRVQAGDTLSSIAQQFGVEVGSIAAANGMEDPNAIAVGAELVIPDPRPMAVAAARAEPTPRPTAAPTSRPTLTPAAAPRAAVASPTAAAATPTPRPQASSQGTYVVQRGDTLYSIARAFGVTPLALQSANQLPSPDRIFVGQRLVIPRGTGPQPSASPTPATPDVVAIARQYLGAPYVFGGTTPAGFDCSGFIFYVFGRAGRTMQRDIWTQYDSGPHISREQLQPGDLVFFQNTYVDGLSHNGIYVGNGQFINAVDEDSGVAVSRLSSPYWAERWYGATRPFLRPSSRA